MRNSRDATKRLDPAVLSSDSCTEELTGLRARRVRS